MSGHGAHRSDESKSGAAILAAFIPTFTVAVVYITVFALVRERSQKFYAPRTFLGTIPEKDRTPSSRARGKSWFHDFKSLPDHFVLQHNSLDAFLFLRFLKFVITLCFIGACITWPILIPIHAVGGGRSSQLDKISFSNIARNDFLWAHIAVSFVLFGGAFGLIVRERLHLIGARQAYILDEARAKSLSSRTVLFLHVPQDALDPGKLKEYFGQDAEQSWPVEDSSGLDDLVEKRKIATFNLEGAQLDLIKATSKHFRKGQQIQEAASSAEGEALLPGPNALQKVLPFTRSIHDKIKKSLAVVVETSESINSRRTAANDNSSSHSAIFVSFQTQAAAHTAYEKISFKPNLPSHTRFLNVQPKDVLWKNLVMSAQVRVSKASFALAFVVVFIIFYSIPSGLIGTLSNVSYLAKKVRWLRWLENLPGWILALLTGLVPPALVSWFQSYVPKLFRHIAKLSGEPTTPQAELKTQAWTFAFQIIQVFLVTTFSSGAAAVAKKTINDPIGTPALLAEALPKASNFYLTYFILQGTTSAADNILNYSDLIEYWFLRYVWHKTPRDQFGDYAQMKGTPWGSWYPKFTNLFVIAIAYACIAPLVLGFAVIGISLYYLAYRYNLLYVRQTKIDTGGENYQRALKQMVTGIYLAQLALIGLFGARKAGKQAVVMTAQLAVTAILNAAVDHKIRPLELYLGRDKWYTDEAPLIAQEEGIDEDDEERIHIAQQSRRLGLQALGGNTSSWLSKLLDTPISSSRDRINTWMHDARSRHFDDAEPPELSDEDLKKAYKNPAFTAETPKLWVPKDRLGISKQIVEENKAVDIETTDEGAEIDDKGRLRWETDFSKVPIFSEPKVI